jgi:hypothetical protein
MNAAEAARDARIASLSDAALLTEVLGKARDEALTASEYDRFKEMALLVRERSWVLTTRQRAWLEEAARKVLPLDSALVPRGREVPTPEVLKKLPLKPPGR